MAEASAAAAIPARPDPLEQLAEAGSIEAARVADNEARLALAALPARGVRFRKGEAADLVAEYRRTRDAYRGRYAAAVEDLPAAAERIATAIMRVADRTDDPDEERKLAEDLVDLQAFVDLGGQPAPLPPARGQSPSRILELVRWRQAAAMHFIRGDASVVGNKVAQKGKWTAIGDARAALDRGRSHRDTQAAGFLAMFTWPVAGPLGALLGEAYGLGTVTTAVWGAVIATWFLSPWLGQFTFAPTEALLTAAGRLLNRTADTLPGIIAFPLVFGPGGLAFVALGALLVAVQGVVGI
jgi:hypothetical protein